MWVEVTPCEPLKGIKYKFKINSAPICVHVCIYTHTKTCHNDSLRKANVPQSPRNIAVEIKSMKAFTLLHCYVIIVLDFQISDGTKEHIAFNSQGYTEQW